MEPRRQRLIGWSLLAAGLVLAVIYYATHLQPNDPSFDDLAGYTKGRNRQVEAMMGKTGVLMIDWQDALSRPGVQAVLIFAGAGLLSAYFFRVAAVLEHDAQHAADVANTRLDSPPRK